MRGAAKRAVFKLGTNIVTRDSGALDVETITDLVRQIAVAHGSGLEIVIASSGAVGAGMDTLINRSPQSRARLRRRNVTARQAAAAIGQVDVIALYKSLFGAFGIDVAQTLLSRSVLNQREGYLNVRGTMETLLEAGIVPIVNENDVVAVEEIVGATYGDNDRLSAMLANVLDADLLVLLGEMDGLHTADPHSDPNAKLIPDVYEITDELRGFAGGPSDDRGRRRDAEQARGGGSGYAVRRRRGHRGWTRRKCHQEGGFLGRRSGRDFIHWYHLRRVASGGCLPAVRRRRAP